MTATVLIIDFDDSFTYNIASTFRQMLSASCLQGTVEVISFRDLKQRNLQEFTCKGKVVVVFGPGPGHPDSYRPAIASFMGDCLNNERVFVMGICLGHQLLAMHFGGKIIKKDPMHGESIPLLIPPWKHFATKYHGQKIDVIRYNSLFATLGKKEGDLLMFAGERFISYQFHPESVGTSCPQAFFDAPIRFFDTKMVL